MVMSLVFMTSVVVSKTNKSGLLESGENGGRVVIDEKLESRRSMVD